jgi:hypothetical protein
MFLSDFLPGKWKIVLKNRVSARVFHEILKYFVENIRNFRRKAGMFSIFGAGKPPSL